jgi:prephenate dehydrogenase
LDSGHDCPFSAWADCWLRYLFAVRWKKVSIVGVGLLGGSLGQALRKRKLASEVVGCVRRQATIAEAKRAGAVDSATLDYIAGVKNADLIVLCTPIAQMARTLAPLVPHLKPGALITDVGSVKGLVVRDLEALAAKAGADFIGSHPMAGSEKTGVSAARPDLYTGAVCVLTPTKKTSPRALKEISQLWTLLGARVVKLSPAKHDQLVARSSHLPHLLAAQLVNHTLGRKEVEQALLCATGFRDTTRIASGSPEMWRDIALANRANLARTLGDFTNELRSLQKLVQSGDHKKLSRFFEQAKQRRDAWCGHTGSTSSE